MDETFIPRPFELAGRFAGFVFTETGKRWMRLSAEGVETPSTVTWTRRFVRRSYALFA